MSVTSCLRILNLEFGMIDSGKVKLSLEIICDEVEGFCEMKKVFSEHPEDHSFTNSVHSIVQKDFHYPTFVRLFSLQGSDSDNSIIHKDCRTSSTNLCINLNFSNNIYRELPS